MKKKILFLIYTFLAFPIFVFAACDLGVRTEENLCVNKTEIKINTWNIENILRTPLVDASEKVYDFSDVLTDEEETDLKNRVNKFIEDTNMDMVIVTIANSYSDYQIEEFADDFFDYNDFGMNFSEKSYDGILAIRNTDNYNRYYYVSTSGIAQIYYNQSRIDNILDAMYNNMHNDNYYEAFIDYIEEAYKQYNKGLPPKYKDCTIDNYGNIYDKNGKIIDPEKGVYYVPYFWCISISLIITIIVIAIMISKNKMIKKATMAQQYLDKNTINYTRKEDQFLSTHTTHYTISSSSGSGSSGSHHSSSGFSHGGGGRHC